MDIPSGHIFMGGVPSVGAEVTDVLGTLGGCVIERIVSLDHATPDGEWYDQAFDEWVVVLQGRAGLLLEGEQQERLLNPGDYVFIAAHLRHRVTWTDPGGETVWLAVKERAPEA